MILSGRLGINDRADRVAASSRLAAHLADIDARRRAAELTVDALVQSWRGGAAVQQESGWQEVDDAARDAIDALSSLLGAIDLAREVVAREEVAREDVAREDVAREDVAREDVAATGHAVAVPRQSDRRARPWTPVASDRLPGEVRSRPAR